MITSIPDSCNSMCEGQQLKFNHEDCAAGTDTKKRLYVKRISSGWLCYCHHCGEKGFIRDDSIRRIESLTCSLAYPHPESEPLAFKLPNPEDLVGFGDWPIEPKLWWLSYGLDESDSKKHPVRYEPKRKLLWVRIGRDGISQARNFGEGPKYYTVNTSEHFNCQYTSIENEPTIIVEDVVSGYKVRKAGFGARTLFGTKFDYTYPVPIRNPVVWLDEDPAGWKAATDIAIKLGCKLINHKQPKECTIEEIKLLVEDK
jgi:hypothetical protein